MDYPQKALPVLLITAYSAQMMDQHDLDVYNFKYQIRSNCEIY